MGARHREAPHLWEGQKLRPHESEGSPASTNPLPSQILCRTSLGLLGGGEKANPPLVPLDCSWFLSAQAMLLFSALEQALITALDACPVSPTLMTEQGKVWDGEDSG